MNVQQLPRKDMVVKKAFVPKLDAMVFADYDQIEMRVLAYYMAMLGDESMKDALADSDTDLHQESARGIFKIDRVVTDAERQLGKNMNFSMVYGGGRPAVLRYLGEFNAAGGRTPVTWKYASEVLDRFHERWPGIKRVHNALLDAHQKQGFTRSIAGFPLHPRSEHSMLNLVVQSSAAEVMRRALRVCHKNLADWDSHLVCVVHDELVFDAAELEFYDLIAALPTWMAYEEINEVVPTTVSIEYTHTNWAEKDGFD